MSKHTPLPLAGEVLSSNEIAELCEVCGYSSVELFGYRRADGWHWACANHRISQIYADKWSPNPDDAGGGR